MTPKHKIPHKVKMQLRRMQQHKRLGLDLHQRELRTHPFPLKYQPRYRLRIDRSKYRPHQGAQERERRLRHAQVV